MTTLPPSPGDPALSGPLSRWLQILASFVKQFRLTEGGPVIVRCTGAPTLTLPNGSLALRDDGTGPNLYVRENGAWVAK